MMLLQKLLDFVESDMKKCICTNSIKIAIEDGKVNGNIFMRNYPFLRNWTIAKLVRVVT